MTVWLVPFCSLSDDGKSLELSQTMRKWVFKHLQNLIKAIHFLSSDSHRYRQRRLRSDCADVLGSISCPETHSSTALLGYLIICLPSTSLMSKSKLKVNLSKHLQKAHHSEVSPFDILSLYDFRYAKFSSSSNHCDTRGHRFPWCSCKYDNILTLLPPFTTVNPLYMTLIYM